MSKPLHDLPADATAATAVEYGLLVALVALACMTALFALAGESTQLWRSVEDASNAATAAAP